MIDVLEPLHPPTILENGPSQDALSLAHFLRTSPARTMLDRICRSVADDTGMESVAIVMRMRGQIEMIATHGVDIIDYYQSVPSAYTPSHDLKFAFECENMQIDPRFSNSIFVKLSPRWKYGAMVMVSHALSQEVDIELWVADNQQHVADGSTLLVMSKAAVHLNDSLGLMIQLWRLNAATAARDLLNIKALLTNGIALSTFNAALVDQDLRIITVSPAMEALQNGLGALPYAAGQSLADFWLDPSAMLQISEAFAAGSVAIRSKTSLANFSDDFDFELLATSFGEYNERFGLFTVQARSIANTSQMVRDSACQPYAGDGPGPVSAFLQSTLIKKQRLSRRKSIAYVSTHSWRTPIKSYQIAALKALKHDPPEALIDTITDNLIDAVQSIYGTGIARYVVPVPCGHSGENCLSRRLAQNMAAKMGLEFVDAFAFIPVKGSSHPKQNMRRPPMRLKEQVSGPIILVDDVVTSGSHIEEASRLLQSTGPTVWPIVWIAD